MNHETQRLFVAASRGARVQYWGLTEGRQTWRSTGVIYSHAEDCQIPQRIHPEDTALQYGPVSTELRRMAEGIKGPYTTAQIMAHEWRMYTADFMPFQNNAHSRWLCAFAAELAADEGI